MKAKGSLLVVDDEANIRRILQAFFEKAGFEVMAAEGGTEALHLLKERKFACVLSDITMPGMSGYDLLKAIKAQPDSPEVVLMTAFGTIPQAVQAIRDGAFEYITKPFDLDSLKKVISSAVKPAAVKRAAVGGTLKAKPFIAVSPAMKEVEAIVSKAADSKATVMIGGESGVGKEVIARMLHDRSSRSSEPFVAVSCAALPETLLESELFGYEPGAFTGANGAKLGRFETASGGTLFLDEVGEIPLSVQVKLLRALQERQIERLGSNQPTDVDVRVVTATHRSLQDAVDAGTFRLDLLYRLQVIELTIPPLRERPEDVEPLAKLFIEKYCQENHRQLLGLNSGALKVMQSYRWPGNVRELENVIERAVVMADEAADELCISLLPKTLQAAA